jgi:hypothetical protein
MVQSDENDVHDWNGPRGEIRQEEQ